MHNLDQKSQKVPIFNFQVFSTNNTKCLYFSMNLVQNASNQSSVVADSVSHQYTLCGTDASHGVTQKKNTRVVLPRGNSGGQQNTKKTIEISTFKPLLPSSSQCSGKYYTLEKKSGCRKKSHEIFSFLCKINIEPYGKKYALTLKRCNISQMQTLDPQGFYRSNFKVFTAE